MNIAIASDHMGLELKNYLQDTLTQLGHSIVNCGTDSIDRCHYPVFAERAAKLVTSGACDRAVLICGTGIGMSIAAAKVPGIRAVVGYDVYSAQMARKHNDTNVLCLGARTMGIDSAVAVLKTWLTTPYEGGRHDIRLRMITDLESGKSVQAD
ncbi:MAG: ribose 5-phosphate isomerase B [Sulfobacillus acidophilus]|uniref:Ribose 5-phosphate isomerase B n=1 Tax=Sulfobacillus acidophilus TaxID=53633 RepID=A0A2T2WDB8_9FIRM|nr:MAG: ribose 5-phosphate isomerase B [Sulfobacillus acidophilus]